MLVRAKLDIEPLGKRNLAIFAADTQLLYLVQVDGASAKEVSRRANVTMVSVHYIHDAWSRIRKAFFIRQINSNLFAVHENGINIVLDHLGQLILSSRVEDANEGVRGAIAVCGGQITTLKNEAA